MFVSLEGIKLDVIFVHDAGAIECGEPEHNASKYPTAVAASAGEQLDTMHVETSLANVLLLQMQLTSDLQTKNKKDERDMNSPRALLTRNKEGISRAYDEQLALCAAESEHARTQGGGEGGDWHHAPRMDREANEKLRQKVPRRTMILLVRNRNSVPRIPSLYRTWGGLGAPHSPKRADLSRIKNSGRGLALSPPWCKKGKGNCQ
jgi:hypothetical protein